MVRDGPREAGRRVVSPWRRGGSGRGLHHRGEAVEELRLADRLGERDRYPGLSGLIAAPAERRQQDEPSDADRGVGLDRARELDAVHPGHLHVEDRQVKGSAVEGCATQRVKCARAVGHGLAEHGPGLDLVLQNRPVGGVVIHNQDPPTLQLEAGAWRG